ncbi:MAG: transcription elongation factor Spt5 [Thermoproteota archaeon]|nr:transcription elongation factor Spt5 [Thermoproteota archaeon]
MTNIIGEIQDDDKGQDETEFGNDTNEHSDDYTDLDTTSKEEDNSVAREYQKDKEETKENQTYSKLGAGRNSSVVSSSSSSSNPTPPNQAVQPISDSKFFAIRTTGGQERVVVNQLQTRANTKKLSIRSIIVLDSFKGYIIVEAPDSNAAYEALAGIRHVRGQIRGDLPFKDIEGYLVKKPVVSELSTNDTVEVIAGPFKSMKAKITRVDYEKQEATVVLLDSPYQIPVTVDANYLKRLAH